MHAHTCTHTHTHTQMHVHTCTHTHTHTCTNTHEHTDYTKLNLHNLKMGSRQRFEMDEDSGMEQKAWLLTVGTQTDTFWYQGMLVHSPLSSLCHCGLILGRKSMELVHTSWPLHNLFLWSTGREWFVKPSPIIFASKEKATTSQNETGV